MKLENVSSFFTFRWSIPGLYPLSIPAFSWKCQKTSSFLMFSNLSLCLVFYISYDSKETELGSSDQEASASAGKTTGVVLVPCSCMEVRPYTYFRWCGYFGGSRVSFVITDGFSMRVTTITSRIGVSWTHNVLWIFDLFKLNELWPYYQNHVNQIILKRTTL